MSKKTLPKVGKTTSKRGSSSKKGATTAAPASVVPAIEGLGENENIVTLIEGLLNIATPIVKALEDGKVSWIEGGGIAMAISFNASKVIKSAPEFWKEFKSLNPLDRAAIKAQFKEGFDISDDKAEAKIEATFDLIVTIAPTISQYVDVIKS